MHLDPSPDATTPGTDKSTLPKTYPWFRLYAEFAGDPNIQSLAFEDQRHFVVVMCLKSMGVLDRDYPSDERREAVIARGLGLDPISCADAKRRLIEAGLILKDWIPRAWDRRQYQSDSSADRMRRLRAHRHGDVTVTPPDTDTDTDTEQRQKNQRRLRRRAPFDFHDPAWLAGKAGSPAPLPVTGGTEAHVTDEHLAELVRCYPGINILEQFGRMRAWLLSNPDRRKTSRGIAAFVARWLAKEQDSARTGASPSGELKFRNKHDEEYLKQLNEKIGGMS